MITPLLVAAALLVVMAVFVIAEAALTRTSPVRAETLSESQPARVARVLELLEAPEAALNPLRFLVLATELTQVVTFALAVRDHLDIGWFVAAVAGDICLVFVTEAAARTSGVMRADSIAVALARPIGALVLFAPIRLLVRGLIGLGNVIAPGKGLSTGPFAVPGELIALADAAVEDEVLEPEERDLIESVIEFGDTVVREVMVPRTDMMSLERDVTIAAALEMSSAAGFSRFPVVGENIDDVVGLVYVKDMIRADLDGEEEERVDTLLRQARFVPETKQVARLLKEMQLESFHMAVVVDEYGGVAGLVTLEDLIEELVGEIVDEYDVEEALVERLADGSLRVDGRALISELNEIADLELSEGDFDTVAGLVFDRFGRVPTEGETCEADGYTFRVERVQARRITRVHIIGGPQRASSRDSEELTS
jgi:CBS domain containing-hemolysin-like protein